MVEPQHSPDHQILIDAAADIRALKQILSGHVAGSIAWRDSMERRLSDCFDALESIRNESDARLSALEQSVAEERGHNAERERIHSVIVWLIGGLVTLIGSAIMNWDRLDVIIKKF